MYVRCKPGVGVTIVIRIYRLIAGLAVCVALWEGRALQGYQRTQGMSSSIVIIFHHKCHQTNHRAIISYGSGEHLAMFSRARPQGRVIARRTTDRCGRRECSSYHPILSEDPNTFNGHSRCLREDHEGLWLGGALADGAHRHANPQPVQVHRLPGSTTSVRWKGGKRGNLPAVEQSLVFVASVDAVNHVRGAAVPVKTS